MIYSNLSICKILFLKGIKSARTLFQQCSFNLKSWNIFFTLSFLNEKLF